MFSILLWCCRLVFCGCFFLVVTFVPSLCSARSKVTPSQKASDSNRSNKASSSTKSSPEVPAPKKSKKAEAPTTRKLNPNRTEFSMLPVLGYSTDRGFRFGAYAVIARFKEDCYPYQWRLYFRLSASVNQTPEGQTLFPFHEDFVRLDLPGLMEGKLRLNLRVGFFRFSTTGYYGMGNNSVLLPTKQSSYYKFDRIYPEAAANARIQLLKNKRGLLSLFLGSNLLYNVTNPSKDSKLWEDIQESRRGGTALSAFLDEQLRGLSAHFLLRFNAGLIWDSRNHEFAPYKGMLSEISLRGAGGFDINSPYLGITTNLRFYQSLWKEYLVLAVRLLGDVLLGHPPYYELYSYGGFFANEGPGGGFSIRGILAQRYYGRAKVIGNVELRSKIIPLSVANQRFNLGLILFLDAGRVWADYNYSDNSLRTQIDGDGPGIKWAFGIGGRLQWGSTVVMRVDVGYSPSDDNIGVFLLLGHMF